MGEPRTFEPKLTLHKDQGVVTFEVYSEGLTITFDIDVDHITQLRDRLKMLNNKYNEDEV